METPITPAASPPDSAPGIERSMIRVFPPGLDSVALAGFLLAGTILGSLLQAYLSATGPLKPAMVALAGIGVVVLIAMFYAAWAGFWALIARLVRQPSRFMSHLCVALIGAWAGIFMGWALSIPCFAFDLEQYGVFVWGNVLLWIVWAIWILSAHLHLATAIASKKIWIGATMFILVLASGGAFAYRALQVHTAMGPGSISLLYPPAFKLASSETTDRHFARLEKLEKSAIRLAAAAEKKS